MAQNPFITKSVWQDEKKKYGIPDNVISGSFGAKMDGFNKKFAAGGFGNMTPTKVPAALALAKDANKVFEAWLKAADKLKPTDFKGAPTNKAKAIERVKMYHSWVQNLENQVKATKDPFISARANYDKCMDAMKKAMAKPDDPALLQTLYSQGIRNWLGAPFHAAVTTYKGEPTVLKMLQDYEKGAAAWHGKMQGQGAATVAGDPALRAKFISDMQDVMRIGVRILGHTKPK